MRHWRPGETVVVRNVANSDGSVTRAIPAIAIRDDEQALAVFIPQGTRSMDKRFGGAASVGQKAASLRYTERVWKDQQTVRIYLPGEPYSVSCFFDGDFAHTGWYGDLHTPFARTPIGVDSRDHALDVVATPAGQWSWKDEEEFARRRELDIDSSAHQASVRAAGEAFIERLRAGSSPFDQGWPRWRPPAGWQPRELPDSWPRDYGSRASFADTNL